ncbi:hypothetical protein [Planctomycetes bacterium CA13]
MQLTNDAEVQAATACQPAATTILRTKLRPPEPPRGLIARSRLIESAGTESAPSFDAGFGAGGLRKEPAGEPLG